MNSDQTWVEALKISPESLSRWSMEAPSGTPLLVWCMTNGHVKTEEYLEWARNHFGFAVLDSRFFTVEFKKENLQGLRDQAPWSAWCFPIGEWDDVTFIACAEPPSEMPEGNFAFVLADPSAMAEVWTEDTKMNTVVDAPMGINLTEPQTFILNLDDIAMADPHAEEPAAPTPPPTPDQPTTMSENTSVTLSVVYDPEKTKANAKPTAPPPPQGKPLAAPVPAPAVAVAPANVAVPKPVAVSAKAPAPAKNSPPPPPASIKAHGKPVDIKATFERLHEMYESVLVMKCGDGQAQPYKWDMHLPIVEGDNKYNVNLSYPGFLRIVAKTMQPYHGYVIDSPAHREFFENLNVKELPACVSAVPLKSGEKLWGMLVAFGGNAAKPPESLNEALAVAEKITLILDLPKATAA